MKKRIPAILLILAVLAAVIWRLVFIPVNFCLPGSPWFRFEGGAGQGSQQGRAAKNPMKTDEFYDADLPYGLSYLSPRSLKETLSGRNARRIRPPGNLAEPNNYFVFTFLDKHSGTWELRFLEDGTIVISHHAENPGLLDHLRAADDALRAKFWGLEPSETRFYRDNGGCYAALKERFGDAEDMESWKKP